MSTTKGGPADIQAADPFSGMSPGDKAQAYNYVMCRQQAVEKTENSTSAAKDTAQSSAAGSVSLALITVLKNTLEKGPHGAHYYYFSLVLIIVALIIQIIIGFLSMTIILVGRRVKENDQIIKESQEWLKKLYASAGGDPAKLTFVSAPQADTTEYDEPTVEQDDPGSEPPKLILQPAPQPTERDALDGNPKGYGSIPPGDASKTQSKWHAFLQWLKLHCCCCFYNKEDETKDHEIENKILYLCKQNEEQITVCPPPVQPAGKGAQQQPDEPAFPGPPPASGQPNSSDPEINLSVDDPTAECDEPAAQADYPPQPPALISKNEAIKNFCNNAWEDEAKQKFFDGQKAAIVQKREVDRLHNMQRVITYLFYVVLLLNGLIAAFVVGG